MDKLKDINNLSSNNISVGQTLFVKTDEPIIDEPIGYEYYTVIKGDSLYSIAKKYNMTVNELKELNNLNSNLISIGQKLIVGETTSSNNYIVKLGDTLYSIAKKFNITVNDLKSANNKQNNLLTIGESLIIPSTSSGTNEETSLYTVKLGDTLYSIAKNFNTTVNEIKELNNLNSNILSINQKLIIPS